MTKALNPTPCPVCGDPGFVAVRTPSIEVYKDSRDVIDHHHHICQSCGGDFATPADVIENRRNVIRFRKSVDKIPSGFEIRAMRIAAKLTIERAGEVFGGGSVAFSKYENDDLIPDTAMVGLLKIAIEDPDFARRLESVRTREVQVKLRKDVKPLTAPVNLGEWIDSTPVVEYTFITNRTQACMLH